MRSVKTAEQFAILRGERPEPTHGPDHTEALAKHIESATAAMRESTAQHEAALLHSLKILQSLAQQMNTPVNVTVSEPEKVLQWKFTCKYDEQDKLISITAKAD